MDAGESRSGDGSSYGFEGRVIPDGLMAWLPDGLISKIRIIGDSFAF
jgi:hypothetical protein